MILDDMFLYLYSISAVIQLIITFSYYNLGYLLLDDSIKILIAFAISTALLIICGCYSTVIGGLLQEQRQSQRQNRTKTSPLPFSSSAAATAP